MKEIDIKSLLTSSDKEMVEIGQQRSKSMGYCEHHQEDIDVETFEYKGCWGCYHFCLDSKYIDLHDASLVLGVSGSTIRRWAKIGKIEGQLFVSDGVKFVSPPRKYFIVAKSLEKLRKKRARVR